MSLNLGSLGMEDASFNFGGSYIMALDCGTTSVLATIVDEYGCIVAQARRSVKTSFPRPGWIEQDPMEVLASQIGVMMEASLRAASILTASPPSVSPTSARPRWCGTA